MLAIVLLLANGEPSLDEHHDQSHDHTQKPFRKSTWLMLRDYSTERGLLRIKQQEATIAIELQEAVMKYKAKMMRTNRWAKPFRLEEEEIQRRETLALRLVEVRRCGGLL